MNEFLMHREMVFKLIGILMILLAAGGCGLTYSRRLRLRLEELRQLQQLMMLLYGEIQYQCTTLPEAFEVCGRQVESTCGAWMCETGERLNAMEGMGFREIWEEQLEKLQNRTVLGKGCMDDLRRLGNQMSFPDRDTQLGALALYSQRLREQEERFSRELPAKMKLGAMLGVLAGMFLVILLI